MRETKLFPRLTTAAARRLLADAAALASEPGRARRDGEAGATWAASGGRRATLDELMEIRTAIVELAEACGFPDGGDRVSRAAFDAHCTAWWGEADALSLGEALRDDVWTWLAVALLPDVVRWRFQGLSAERFLGGVRNTFQRQWMRARAFDRGEGVEARWRLVERLPEDALVQVMERPSVGSQPELARAIGEVWLKQSEGPQGPPSEDLTRAAVRDLRILNETQLLAGLEADDRQAVVAATFAAAAARLGRQSPGEAELAVEATTPRRKSLMGALFRRVGA
jgi:hypothetical protein